MSVMHKNNEVEARSYKDVLHWL